MIVLRNTRLDLRLNWSRIGEDTKVSDGSPDFFDGWKRFTVASHRMRPVQPLNRLISAHQLPDTMRHLALLSTALLIALSACKKEEPAQRCTSANAQGEGEQENDGIVDTWVATAYFENGSDVLSGGCAQITMVIDGIATAGDVSITCQSGTTLLAGTYTHDTNGSVFTVWSGAEVAKTYDIALDGNVLTLDDTSHSSTWERD